MEYFMKICVGESLGCQAIFFYIKLIPSIEGHKSIILFDSSSGPLFLF